MTHLGRVVQIFIARTPRDPMVAVAEARAMAGQGLEGDRYFGQASTGSRRRAGAEVSLVELEVLEALERDHGIRLDPPSTRRNLATRGVCLNGLVRREFRVGEVLLRGVSLCEPCAHLERATHKGIVRALVHRGGLRARILVGGTIRAGDIVVEQAGEPTANS